MLTILCRCLIFLAFLNDFSPVLATVGAHAMGKHRFEAVGALDSVEIGKMVVRPSHIPIGTGCPSFWYSHNILLFKFQVFRGLRKTIALINCNLELGIWQINQSLSILSPRSTARRGSPASCSQLHCSRLRFAPQRVHKPRQPSLHNMVIGMSRANCSRK